MLKKARLLTSPTPARQDAPFRGQGRASEAARRTLGTFSLWTKQERNYQTFPHPAKPAGGEVPCRLNVIERGGRHEVMGGAGDPEW